MSIFFRREFYGKAVSFLLTLAFLAESTLAPVLLFLPQTARAAVSPAVSLSSYNFTVGTSLAITVSGGMPNAEVKVFCRDPNNAVCDDSVSYATNSSGQFTHTYDTTGWTLGNYSGWVTVGGTKSNTVYFAVASAPASGTPPSLAISNADTKINPSPIILGQEVRFSTKLTVGGATAQNFQIKLDASDSLQLKGAYRDASCSASPLSDPLQPASTRAGTKAYLWPANYFSGGIAPGTYDFCFKFQAPANTTQSSASFYIDVSSITSAYNVTAKAVSGAAFSAPATVPTTITISRSPSTSQTNPYKVGDATTFSSVSSPSFFSTDQQITGYNQIGAGTPRTFTASTFALRDNGSCNATTGACAIPGNWDASSLACPAGVTGVQQMTEWYIINNTTSNKLTWYFECSATNVPATRTPVGSLGGVDTSGAATGWAVDPDSSSTPISVHFYVDGAAGQGGTYAGSAVANLASSAANSAGYAGNHGYSFSIPSQWRDGQEHTLYAHGIDLSGDGSKNVLLSGVPQSFTLGAPSIATTMQNNALPVGATAAYKGNGKVWVASRINSDTILFERWDDPLSSTNIIWRSKSQDGAIVSESSSEIQYKPVTFYDHGMPADVFGQSDGPYDIWLTPTGLSTARSGQTKTLTAMRIGYGTIPAFYSRQWCGLNTICNKAGEDQWDGWPISGFMLQQENGTDVASIFFSPFGLGLEIIQATLIGNGTSKELRGQAYKPCSAWTTTLGLCKDGVLYKAGADEVLRVKLDEQNLQWWYDRDFNGSAGCEEFGKQGAQYPRDTVVPHAVAIKLTDRNSPTRAESSWAASKEGACTATNSSVSYPVFSLPSSSFVAGVSFVGSVTQATPNAHIRLFSKGPDGVTAEYASGTTSATGTFSQTYNTTGWNPGAYQAWVEVDGVQSNIVSFAVISAPSTPGRPTPTPTTAPMATLTLERDQEQVLPNQPVSFSGTLDSSKVTFPQGSTLFIAISEKTSIERIEMDGRVLGAGEFTLSNGNAKVPFSQALYNGPHSFRIVLRNEVSLVPQLDRNVAIWVSVVGADGALLLKGRTASTMMAHLPTEIIGKGVSLSVPGMMGGGSCCWSSVAFPLLASGASSVPGSSLVASNRIKFPIREFSFGETDITRGPFFTPNPVPILPENIAFTLFPGDATMQRIGLSLKQFSDPLAREFITAQYQYLLGRDPSSEEMARYLPRFTGWRNPLANLAEVYNRRSDIQQLVLVPRDKNIGGSNSGSPRPSWDKLLEWVRTSGWREEPTLASFKPQSGFDNGWQSFKELFEKFMSAYAGVQGFLIEGEATPTTFAAAHAETNPIAAIANLCVASNSSHNHFSKLLEDPIDFEFCWKNDPMVRDYAILWAKDSGWAYNSFVTEKGDSGSDIPYTYPVVATINPSGPILAPMFGPGKYPEFAEEQQLRYPPAQLYYDIISSQEYAQSVEQRFRANIDSIFRLFFSRPASESDIAWAKDKFISGGNKKSIGYGRFYSWITPQWEPNGALIASNFQYMDEVEFVKNPRFITDDVYGIRHIQGEVDAVSSRLVEMIEKHGRQELYQGDNFKRTVSGIYRLYLRRDPTDAELEKHRASGKSFGDIEFKLNQSSEYGDEPASPEAIRSLYRNYLGRDPSDADVASWGDKTISSIANKIGKSAEMKSIAQQHPENAYIFPVKEIKIKKCGFFCSVLGKIIGIAIAVVASYFGQPWAIMGFTGGLATGGIGAAVGGAALASIDASFNLTQRVIGSLSKGFSESGFNGETFVSHVSIARAMAGQAGGVFNMANILENADPTILDGFRTMAVAPQTFGNAFAQVGQSYPGLASPLGAVLGLFGAGQTASVGRVAQIDVSSHYGSGAVAPVKSSTGTAKTATAKVQFTKTLSQGSRGAEVLKLQKLLGETDFTFLPEYQTGYYGAKTVAAVKRFQKRNGLEQVGFVGQRTRALLNTWGK